MHTWKTRSLPTTKNNSANSYTKRSRRSLSQALPLECDSNVNLLSKAEAVALSLPLVRVPALARGASLHLTKVACTLAKTLDATTTLTALLQEEQQSNREAILPNRAAVDDLLLRASPGCERREGSGWHPRARTGPCWVPKGRQRARAGHRKAHGGLWGAPKGKRRALGSPKREMEGLGRHRKAVWQPLACPKRPTPVPKGHGKAEAP